MFLYSDDETSLNVYLSQGYGIVGIKSDNDFLPGDIIIRCEAYRKILDESNGYYTYFAEGIGLINDVTYNDEKKYSRDDKIFLINNPTTNTIYQNEAALEKAVALYQTCQIEPSPLSSNPSYYKMLGYYSSTSPDSIVLEKNEDNILLRLIKSPYNIVCNRYTDKFERKNNYRTYEDIIPFIGKDTNKKYQDLTLILEEDLTIYLG